jgi:competence protein ComEC
VPRGVDPRPPARWGALATALSVLLVLDPSRLGSPGFQLSFLGAAGLVAWSHPFSEVVARWTRGRCPRPLRSAIGAGAAATVATLPVVAWHFGRVSLVGVPLTVAASPLVSLALPGAILSILVDFAFPALAVFLAGGVDWVLAGLQGVTRAVGSASWISVWTSRPSVVAGLAGVASATLVARHPRVGARGRRALVGAYLTIGIVAWPLLAGLGRRGTLEVVAIDVGQGDAIALRSPRGRWVLVDTGPQGDEDPGAHPVVRALRARGVRRLDALFLTHPDLDHIGGATSVIGTFDIGAIFDPALPVGRGPYADVLAAARAEGIPWLAARAGRALDVDGMRVAVLSPPQALHEGVEANEASVVLHVALGAFDVVLTGDAYRPTERLLAETLGDVEVLKVGHHGSETSTDPLFLARTRPEIGLISVGRSNRYGHPAAGVLDRLRQAGVEIRRTDLEGTLTVVGRPDGSFTVRSER